MEEEHREPWEILAIVTAGYLGVVLWHCVITAIEYMMAFVNYKGELNLGDWVEIPLLL